MTYSLKSDYEDIWDNFGLDVVRSAFFPGISQRDVKRVSLGIKVSLIPILSSMQLKNYNHDTLELIKVLDSYKDYRFREDVNPIIELARRARSKIIVDIL